MLDNVLCRILGDEGAYNVILEEALDERVISLLTSKVEEKNIQNGRLAS
jgi:hypothetical protein